MKPKERVLAAIEHSEPDRVPINYIANAGIHQRLTKHFGIADNDRETLLEALQVDFRGVGVPYCGARLHPAVPGIHVDPQWGIQRVWIEHETGGYWDYTGFPLKEASVEDVEQWPMPSPEDYDYGAVKRACDQNAEYAIHFGGPGLGDIINKSGMLRSMEQVLVDLMTDDPAGIRLIDRRMDVVVETTTRALEAAADRIDLLWIGEDLGTQLGPMISLDLFRKHIRPRHQRLVDAAKAFDLPVMIHSCGSSSWAFDEFIDMGINVVDTLQPEAARMEPAFLKQSFGDKLAFHGCISTAGPVAFGTPEQVQQSVRETLEIMMPGGGYCLAPTHALQDNSPTENVLAMYETALTYGRY